MIITRTPYRVSLFGGGSDYPSWFSKFGGAVLTTTIDQYCYVALRRTPAFVGSKYRVQWAKIEECDRLEDIDHNGVRGCLQCLGFKGGVEVVHMGDLPARSGLGSSSAFVVGMLHALHVLNGDKLEPFQLSLEAITVEQKILKETVGVQDQIQCARGGLNHIRIFTSGTYVMEPKMPPDWLEDHLVLVFTGKQRYASEVAKEQVDNVERNEKLMHELVALVDLAVPVIQDGSPRELGELLHETWMLKKQLSDKISDTWLDDMYNAARSAGAWGGKLLGAGGGGFFLFCVPPQSRQQILNALDLPHVDFKIEHRGSQIVQAG